MSAAIRPRWTRATLADGRTAYGYTGHWSWSVKRDPASTYRWLLTRDGRPWEIADSMRFAKHIAEAREAEYLDGLPVAVADLTPAGRNAVVREAVARFQSELTRTAPLLGAVLEQEGGTR